MKNPQSKTTTIAAIPLAMIVVLISRIGREEPPPTQVWEDETNTGKTYNLAWWNPDGEIYNSTINADNTSIALNEVAVNGQNITLAENGLYAYNAIINNSSSSVVEIGSMNYDQYVRDEQGRCFFPSISPDGTYIACLYLGKVWTVNAKNGEMTFLDAESLDAPGAPTAYNNVIVYPFMTGNQSNLRVVDRITGKILETLRADQQPAFNNSGSHYALLSRSYTRGEYSIDWYTSIGKRVKQSDKLMLGEAVRDASLVAVSDSGDYALLRISDGSDYDTLQMVDIRNAQTWQVDSNSPSSIISADFSSDGQRIAWVRDGMVYVASEGLHGEAFYVANGVSVRWIEKS